MPAQSVCLIVQGVYDFDPRVRRKAEALVSGGYVVDVLALAPSDGRTRYELNGVKVCGLNLSKKRGSRLRYAYEYMAFFVWAMVTAGSRMRQRHYAVVDVNTLPDFLVFAAVFAKWMGARVVLDMHEITPEFYMSKYGVTRQSIAVRALELVERLSMRFADHVLAINEPIQTLLAGRGLVQQRSTVIMNAVDEARFRATSPAPSSEPLADSGKFVFMYHGTLTKIYGLDIAVEALAHARTQIPSAELWILGSGPEVAGLQAQAERLGIAGNVRLVGQVPATEIPSWLSRCNAGILPIRRDVFLDFAFPNKLPEFITARRPVLISRLKAIRYYFSDDALAYFEPNDPVDLARQMVALVNNADRRDCLIARATDEYQVIRWDVMKERYLALIARLSGPQGTV